MNISGLSNKHGFTLIEIVVAMAILSIAILGMASVTVMVIKGNHLSKTITTATMLAKDKMEQLKITSYDHLAPGTDYAKADSTIQTSPTADSLYTRTWARVFNDPAANMATISVTVQWNWQGTPRNVTIRSIVAR